MTFNPYPAPASSAEKPAANGQRNRSPRATRRPDPLVVAEVRTIIFGRPGREWAITGGDLVRLLEERGFGRLALRRIGEAVAVLIEQGEPIGSASTDPAGYWLIVSDEERQEARRELVKRLVSLGRRLKAFDRQAGERVEQLALGLGQ